MPAWEDRDSWLALLEELFDERTVGRLERLGVGADWDVLEIGAGRGSMARWLAGRAGRVVATDIDTSLLGGDGYEVLCADVLRDGFPDASFDLVLCRAVLVHVLAPARALERMASWLRPGGVLMAEEPWIEAGTLSPDPVAARAAGALHMDRGFARRLPQALREAGLERVSVDAPLMWFEGGSRLADFFRLTLEGAAEPLVASGEMGAEEVAGMGERFRDPSWSDCGWPRIAAWGWKPAGQRA